ncbi:hypothetical protein N7478_009919 [Penicillium angulare]|uniref:uncharacterized protein n=1 Tax=Penicillium angulare TaxID=116970 RepID=UPI0025403097|nr:uncharacterized protein N7478_009919 [Penicillium angulare]KAJ5267111.1 hypothetical protein N7478_009919 [Penicillium angulare]
MSEPITSQPTKLVAPQPAQTAPTQTAPTQTAPADVLTSSHPLASALLGSDATENEEIAKIWAEVQDRVRQLSAREGKQIILSKEHRSITQSPPSSDL